MRISRICTGLTAVACIAVLSMVCMPCMPRAFANADQPFPKVTVNQEGKAKGMWVDDDRAEFACIYDLDDWKGDARKSLPYVAVYVKKDGKIKGMPYALNMSDRELKLQIPPHQGQKDPDVLRMRRVEALIDAARELKNPTKPTDGFSPVRSTVDRIKDLMEAIDNLHNDVRSSTVHRGNPVLCSHKHKSITMHRTTASSSAACSCSCSGCMCNSAPQAAASDAPTTTVTRHNHKHRTRTAS